MPTKAGWRGFTARVLWFKQQCRAAAKRAFTEVLDAGGVDCFLRDLLKAVRARGPSCRAFSPPCRPHGGVFLATSPLPQRRRWLHTCSASMAARLVSVAMLRAPSALPVALSFMTPSVCRSIYVTPGNAVMCWLQLVDSLLMQPLDWESFPLCPPQATGEAILCKEACDRRWDEVPDMRCAFAELANLLLEATQYSMDNIASAVYDILLQYPLFPDEYAMVLQRIADDAAEVVALGESPWGDDSAAMVQVLRTIALSNELYLFTRASGSRVDDSLPAHRLSEADWASFLTRGSANPVRTVHVALDDAQGTNCAFPCTDAVDGCRFLELCEQGELDDCAVVVHAPRYLEAAEYLGVRAAQSTALGPAVRFYGMHFCVPGATPAREASFNFLSWVLLSVPFCCPSSPLPPLLRMPN